MPILNISRGLQCAGALLCGLAALPAGAADAPPPNTDWPTYNNDLQAQRYSPLKQINAGNVAQMKEVCRIKLQDGGSFHAGPIVIDGVLYTTTARDTVAVDARNCHEIWRHTYASSREDVWPVNRGVAYMNGRLFRGYGNGGFAAIDAKTGKTLWEDEVGDPHRGEFLSGAPVAVNGIVYTGTAGSDWGMRGRVMAFSAEDGRELWRFNLIPTGSEPGAETWKVAHSALTGGGGTWSSFALDVARGELVVPVGNPAPDLNADYRPGANLYTDSVVVLDARTGALKWYYQVKAHDGVDHDIAATPVLLRTPEVQDMMVFGGKDGSVYGIDIETRKLVYSTPVTTIDSEGAIPDEKGVHVCPGLLGGVEWNGPAYEPSKNSLIVGTVDWCTLFKRGPAKYIGGAFFFGGDPVMDPIAQGKGWVTSLDAGTGKINWQYKTDAPVVAGVTPTAGGVVFTGNIGGKFLALDSASGKELFTMQTPGMLGGGMVTYAIDGKQYVAFNSGNVSRVLWGELGDPTLIVLGL